MARALSMEPAEERVSSRSKTGPGARLVDGVCLPVLRNAQNEDGGWGYHPGFESRVEPTCWALQALLVSTSLGNSKATIAKALHFLRNAQLPDGSWPSAPTQKEGCWVTSLACWTLLFERDASQVVAAGLRWLCDDWPRESSLWLRFLRRLSREQSAPYQHSYRGWGWTPGTSSWVEPTALALIALGLSSDSLLPSGAARRRKLAQAWLYDRVCDHGGWNSGNPSVYGVSGDPLVIPTVWALLALRDCSDRSENAASLDWLERNLAHVQGPGSLALARICLETYGRAWPMTAPESFDPDHSSELLRNILVTAWVCMAFGARRHWLVRASQEMA